MWAWSFAFLGCEGSRGLQRHPPSELLPKSTRDGKMWGEDKGSGERVERKGVPGPTQPFVRALWGRSWEPTSFQMREVMTSSTVCLPDESRCFLQLLGEVTDKPDLVVCEPYNMYLGKHRSFLTLLILELQGTLVEITQLAPVSLFLPHLSKPR